MLMVALIGAGLAIYAHWLDMVRPFGQPLLMHHSRIPICTNSIEGRFDPSLDSVSFETPNDMRCVLYYYAQVCHAYRTYRCWLSEPGFAGVGQSWRAVRSSYVEATFAEAEFDRGAYWLLSNKRQCQSVCAVFLDKPQDDWSQLSLVSDARAVVAWNYCAHQDWNNQDGIVSLARLLRFDICHEVELLQIPGGDSPNRDDVLLLVGKLTQLRGLSLWNVNITDEGLVHLVPLQRLLVLNLDGCDITDEGLRHVGKLRSLKSLSLNGTKITDDGLEHLTSLDDLIELRVYATDVTKQKIDQLQGTMPKLKYIEYGVEGQEPLTIP